MIDDSGANLPIPNRERNNGGELEVCQYPHQVNGPHPWPWRKTAHDDESQLESCRHPPPPPERKILNIKLPTFILSSVLLVVIAALIITAGLLGSKIAGLERTIPLLPTTTSPSSDDGRNTTDTNQHPPATTQHPPTITYVPSVPVPGWTYLGCFYDSRLRVLPYQKPSARNMTNGYCADMCAADNPMHHRHAGTQHGNQCFCGTATPENMRRAPDWACNDQCSGQPIKMENCGGNWVLSIWEKAGS
ncbi:Xylosyltransferase oxt [Madurella mycetomatis]|uniref:Xylosyltransferase oxt n=1 Tax=Madurella mycetomatis TaxID=100816 RepID=A0A175W6S2_9PEZI|nr:Xylosyltransferase oxt [Madurella mycetomatis]